MTNDSTSFVDSQDTRGKHERRTQEKRVIERKENLCFTLWPTAKPMYSSRDNNDDDDQKRKIKMEKRRRQREMRRGEKTRPGNRPKTSTTIFPPSSSWIDARKEKKRKRERICRMPTSTSIHLPLLPTTMSMSMEIRRIVVVGRSTVDSSRVRVNKEKNALNA